MLRELLAALLILGTTIPAYGQVYQLQDGVLVVTGEVHQISKQEMTIRYFSKNERKEIIIVFAESTEVTGIDGLEKLKVGDNVQVEFERRDEQYVARRIFVLLAGG